MVPAGPDGLPVEGRAPGALPRAPTFANTRVPAASPRSTNPPCSVGQASHDMRSQTSVKRQQARPANVLIVFVVTGSSGVAARSGATSAFMTSTVRWVTKRRQSTLRPSTKLSRGSTCPHDWNAWLQNDVHQARLRASSVEQRAFSQARKASRRTSR